MTPTWKKHTRKLERATVEMRLQLTENVVITMTDYGWSVQPILASLHCSMPALDGPLDALRESVPGKLLACLEEAMPVLRSLTNSKSGQVDFPAAVDPAAAIERGE